MVKRIFFLVALLTLTSLVGVFYVASTLDKPLQHDRVWDVPHGTSLNVVMQRLQPHASKAMLRAQRILLGWRGVDLEIRAGEYRLKPSMTLRDTLALLVSGDVVLHSVTLIEGWTVQDAQRHINTLNILQQDIQANLDTTALGIKDHFASVEGWLAPDTYLVRRGSNASELYQAAYQRMVSWLEDAWQQRDESLPLASPYELLILASIVEKETALVSERGAIASVFINRLRQGMRLQTDPTVIYGLGDKFDGDLTRRDLAEKTPYNTYVIRGLPPTPISLPSRDALLAVALAPETPYLYFVAKGDGSSYFSTSLEEHQAAVRRYQLQRREDYRSRPQLGNGNGR